MCMDECTLNRTKKRSFAKELNGLVKIIDQTIKKRNIISLFNGLLELELVCNLNELKTLFIMMVLPWHSE